MICWKTLLSTDGVGHDWTNFNKINMPVNEFKFTIADIEKFNEYLKWCKANLKEVEPTESGSMPNGPEKRFFRYCVSQDKSGAIELLVAMNGRHYRLVMAASYREANPMSGSSAMKTWWKVAKEYNLVDVIHEYALDKEDGQDLKETIHKAHVQVLCSKHLLGKEFKHVYHLDFISSYGSRICEMDDRFRPMFEHLYHLRNKNSSYKFVLNASIGMMQSKYCTDEKGKRRPFMLAQLSKCAVDGTYNLVEEYKQKLRNAGMVPLLSNTDGIWYQSDLGPYHDENEGNDLGMWKNDHKDVKFTMKSPGVYQYMEDGKVFTVMRGICNLDKVKTRDQFEWMEIYKTGAEFLHVEYDKREGVINYYESEY